MNEKSPFRSLKSLLHNGEADTGRVEAFFAQLTRADRGVLYLHGLFLLCICFTPFPAALQAAYPGSHPATCVMALAMFLTACSFSVLRWYTTFIAHVIDPTISTAMRRRMMRKSLMAPAL